MVYKQIVSADALSGVITMPSVFKNKRVEVIIRDLPEVAPIQNINLSDIGRMMSGSITQSLIGIVPNSGKTLDEYRAERLSKYECVD